ncbi:hypothetical protein [Trichormus azollae]|uniref:Uncharacterized protein n=1 Tax=Nostoc azollae (strain 0708) TaxID=551115 RepID=D7E542_NOSA0|nr:hypothetical protein [Trichormus azollae]ADI63839.1 conserved hypothetical protein ['Nostoc azollae' 0708]
MADSLAKIITFDSEFGFDIERIDAQDRSDRRKSQAKRKNALTEIATSLEHSLHAELFRHQNKIANITSREKVQSERQAIQQSVREKHQSLMQRVKLGSRGRNPPEEKINVG